MYRYSVEYLSVERGTAPSGNDEIFCVDCDYACAAGPTKVIRGVF